MIKSFPVTEGTGFEFRAEAYNFINHPNLSGPNLNPTSSQFGLVTGKTTSNPRTLQVGLRFHYQASDNPDHSCPARSKGCAGFLRLTCCEYFRPVLSTSCTCLHMDCTVFAPCRAGARSLVLGMARLCSAR